ncbi:MAG: DUF2782 domain-containing protein [Chromatiales bacterium]|nr:DUF2782 domain-containing protein [Gammaproteobacteria bacterium]MBW6476207.1 DUF2782 domain-containing protein [Chromatiales bacterium]
MRYLLLLLLPISVALQAQPLAEVPPPPALPEQVPDAVDVEDQFEPEIRILRRGEDTIEEFRSGGRLYMVRITPAKGRPYYLIDSDGNGILDTRREALQPPELVKWRIFSW